MSWRFFCWPMEVFHRSPIHPKQPPKSPSRRFFEWFFRKDYCFSKGLKPVINNSR